MFNKPPVIDSLTPSATTVARGESCTIICAATDPDADTLTYAWSTTGGAISGEGDTVTWTAPDTEGTYTISVTVSDDSGESASDSCTIEVVNNPPVIASLVPSAISVAPGESCTVSCDASDADDDILTYEWSFTNGEISGEGSTVTWTAPETEGIYTIGVTVSDGRGGTAGASCDITVAMKFGVLDIQSDPAGAAVYLNGVDTGNITPYIITNLAPGTYTVKLEYYHYKYKEATVTINADETTYINWALTYAEEETLTIQPGAAEGIDAYVCGGCANAGNDAELVAGSRGAGTYRTYLQFSLDSLPEDAVITDARLGLYYHSAILNHPADIGVYLVLAAWAEDSIIWDNQPDFATVPEDAFTVLASPTYDFIFWYISDMVKGWWDGSLPNYGVVLKVLDEASWPDWKYFYSSDSGVTVSRPKLEITYFDPTP